MLPGLSTVDADLPLSGEAYFYLIQSRDAGCGGAGSLGVDSSGVARISPCP